MKSINYIFLLSILLFPFKSITQDSNKVVLVGVEPFSIDNWRTLLADTVVDFNGNIYHTQKIGTQTWMLENLSVTKFNDGVEIPIIMDSLAWTTTAKPASYCSELTHRYYYNYYVIESEKNVCPVGWRVPDSTDIKVLENYVALANQEFARGTGIAINDTAYFYTDSTLWVDYPLVGFSFSDQAYGYISGISGGFIGGPYGYWWIHNSESVAQAYRDIMYKGFGVDDIHLGEITYQNTEYGFQKNHGLSVRCIKN